MTKVSAAVAYPFLISNPLTAINPIDYFKVSGPDGFAYANDGTLGYSSNLFNTWVFTAANQAKVAAGGSFGLDFYTNVAEARIKDGALINQNNDPRFRAGKQSVSVGANTSMNLISITGVGSLSLNIAGGVKAIEKIKKGDKIDALKSLVIPLRRGGR